MRLRIAVKSDMTYLRNRNQLQKPVHHAEARAQNRNDGQLFAGNHLSRHFAERRFDFHIFKGQIARHFVAHQHRDFIKQLAKILRTCFLLSHISEFVLNQRMIDHVKFAHVYSPLYFNSRFVL